MNGWIVISLLLLCQLARAGQLTVAYGQTVRVAVPGALAAFSFNDLYVEVRAEAGTLTIFGKNAGSANIVVVSDQGTQTFEVRVLAPPPFYPPGFVAPLSAEAERENGSYELRFTSNPSQLQNVADFQRNEGDRLVRVHVAGTLQFSDFSNRSIFALGSGFYQVSTPGRDFTLLDQLVSNSPLTIDRSVVRGFHLRQGNFFFHAGYTSSSTFEDLILPSQKEGVAGAGYRLSAGKHAYFMPNFYYFSGSEGSETSVPSGTVASLVYAYEASRNAGVLLETGFSHGLGAAGRFHSYQQHDQVTANLRYEPAHFAAVSLNNLHGFYSNFDWTRDITPRLFSGIRFSGDHYNLPSFNLTDILANLNLRFQVSPRWSLTSGTSYGRSEPHFPVGPVVSTTGWPVGVNFDATHFQAGFVYRSSTGSGAVSRSDQFRATVGTRWAGFHWNGFVDRQSQALTIAFNASGTPALQDTLDRLGISADTPEQVALALSETAGLLNQKFIQSIRIGVTPVRTQSGTDLTWTSHAHSHQQVDFRVLYSQNETLQGDTRVMIGTFSYSRRFKDVNEIFFSVSLLRESSYPSHPIFEISLRRQLGSAPNFIISRGHGNISGTVFADDGATGAYQPKARLLPDVEVVLDETRRSRTDKSGRYMFSHVSYGLHTVEVVYGSASPFFYATASRVQSGINEEVNFGIGVSGARLFGSVRSDTGIGVAGVEISVSNGEATFRARTDAEGKFRVEGLSSGEYEIKIDDDSVPVGYSLAGSAPKRTTVDPSAPAQSAFTLQANRSISGRVSIYDRASRQEMPVAGVAVILQEISRECTTDGNGVYLFRDLPPGAYSVVVVHQGKKTQKNVTLPDYPAFPKNIDIHLVAD